MVEVLEEPRLKTLPSEVRQRDTKPERLTAKEFNTRSGISLWDVNYEGRPQLSVFVYPVDYIVNREKILALDSNFSNVRAGGSSQLYKGVSYDVLNETFMREVGSGASFLDHTYSIPGSRRVYEHSFVLTARRFLEAIIGDLESKIRREDIE